MPNSTNASLQQFGNFYFYVTNSDAYDISQLNAAIIYLENSSYAASILEGAHNLGVTINFSVNENDNYVSATNIVNWCPNMAVGVRSNVGFGYANGQVTGVISAALALIHECAHATDLVTRARDANGKPIIKNDQYDDVAEAYAVSQERIVASQLGETLRYNHGGSIGYEGNSTEHTIPQAGSYAWQMQGLNGAITITGSSFQPGMPNQTGIVQIHPHAALLTTIENAPVLATFPNGNVKATRTHSINAFAAKS